MTKDQIKIKFTEWKKSFSICSYAFNDSSSNWYTNIKLTTFTFSSFSWNLTSVIYIPTGKVYWLSFGWISNWYPPYLKIALLLTTYLIYISYYYKKILVLEKHNFYASQHNMVMKRFFLRKKNRSIPYVPPKLYPL